MNAEVIDFGASVKRDCVWKTPGRILEAHWNGCPGCSWERYFLSDPIGGE